jgi:hypothetical protein
MKLHFQIWFFPCLSAVPKPPQMNISIAEMQCPGTDDLLFTGN